MEILRTDVTGAAPIGPRPFAVERVSSLELAAGSGEAHAYLLFFEPGGEIGRHEAGYGQLFLVVSGSGWVAGDDGERTVLSAGEAALFRRGEVHSKGSRDGMTALMVQVRELSWRPA